MVSHQCKLATEQFVLPFEQGLDYRQGLLLKRKVRMLRVGEFLRHEPSRAAILPAGPLAIHRTDANTRGVGDQPDRVWVVGVDGPQDGGLASEEFNLLKAFLVQWPSEKYLAIAHHR